MSGPRQRSLLLERHVRHLLPACCIALLGFLTTPCGTAAAAQPTAQIDQGTLSGLESGGVEEYLGVRYAQPPVGNLRWQPPVPVPPSRTHVNATQFGNNCPQNPAPWGTPSTTEDCLFLNVYVPASAHGHDNDHDHDRGNLPVMLWLYGGGFVAGQGSVYDPTALVKQGNVIVVTINYRLGALGLFAHPALDAEHHLVANYALMDQQLALKWVARNISSFGGDPGNVTIFGESAGGIAIYAHLTSPLSSGLFQRAIIESGAPDYLTLKQAESDGLTLAQKVGCTAGSPQQVAACLRRVPVAQLLANQATETGAIVEGVLLPQPPADAIAQRKVNRATIINGTNHDEGRLIAAFIWDLSGAPLQASGYQSALEIISNFLPGTGYPLSAIPAIMQAYPLSKYPSPDLAAAAVITDGTIACPALEMDKALSQAVPLFAYQFDDANAPEIVAPPVSFPYGATHFSELQYIFNMSALTLPGTPALTPAQQQLSASMMRYWTDFAHSGNPNHPGQPPLWGPFKSQRGGLFQSLETPSPRGETDFSAIHNCDFWKTVRDLFS